MSNPVAGGYLDRAPDPVDRLRLFCFHHAGGGASAFRGWRDGLAPELAVFPVQLPGREGRADEAASTDITALVADLTARLDPLFDRPFAFYGHSMGALVAYRLTCALAMRRGPLPVRLLVGAYHGPQRTSGLEQLKRMADPDLLAMLIDSGGLPGTVLGYPKWTAAMVRLLRTDLALCASHEPTRSAPLPVPLHVFTGDADPLMPIAEAESWAPLATAGHRTHVLPGGHFFIRESRPLMLATVRELLVD
jgi:surfactin synthase thioesterase subunit